METKKTPTSIQVIYWLTTLALGLLTTVFLATIAFNALLYTDFFGDNMQLHIDLPGKVDFLKTGNYHINYQDVKVELVEASTRIHFFNTPDFITKKVGFVLLLVAFSATYLTWLFWKFIYNVRRGEIFNIKNISLLKKLAYGIAGFWLFTIIYMRIAYYYISMRLDFDNILISSDFSNYPGVLLMALFIWVLAHIFMTGVKLQEDNDLTI